MYRDWGIRNFMALHWTGWVGSKDSERNPIGFRTKKMVTELSLVEKKDIRVGQPKTLGVVI